MQLNIIRMVINIPDNDGYPTDEELEKVKTWDVYKQGTMSLIRYLEHLWHWSDRCFKYELDGTLELHTGGWSGNEFIILALQENTYFFTLFWQKTERGGHYYFSGIKEAKEAK